MEHKDDLFIVIRWPEVQELMDCEGFDENACLVNDVVGVARYGGSAYFVNVNWYKKWLLEMAVKEANK